MLDWPRSGLVQDHNASRSGITGPRTLDPRTEFTVMLREIWAMVEGEHSVMNRKPQRIPAVNDKRAISTIF
jgi:hypothetical protein